MPDDPDPFHPSPPVTSASRTSTGGPPADELAAQFPALRVLLGAECFGQLRTEALLRAEARGQRPGATIHGRLVQPDAPRPAHVPARLAADVAAVEWALCESARLAPATLGLPRLTVAAFDALRDEARDHTVLEPLPSLRIVPVAFRLDSWLRAAREGRPLPRLPRRQERALLVHPLVGPGSIPRAGADGDPEPPAGPIWFEGVDAPVGRLLSLLALGTPLGPALADAAARGLPEPAALTALVEAVLEGLFTGMHRA